MKWLVRLFSLFFHSRCRNISYHANLPQVSIIFIFVNEALSVILRSIHSAIRRTPAHLLKEIILVDDNSNNGTYRLSIPQDTKQEGVVYAQSHRALIAML